MGMNLLEIRSQDEQDQFVNALQENNLHDLGWRWGGGNKNRGVWVWESNADPFPYTNWASGEPSGPNEYCMHFFANYLWNDNDCNRELEYFCYTKP